MNIVECLYNEVAFSVLQVACYIESVIVCSSNWATNAAWCFWIPQVILHVVFKANMSEAPKEL